MGARPRARFAPRSFPNDVRHDTAYLREQRAFSGWKALLDEAYRLDGFVGVVQASALALQMVDEFAAAAQLQNLPINLARETVSNAWLERWAMPLTAKLEDVAAPASFAATIERFSEDEQR